jgi:hypothetical protein
MQDFHVPTTANPVGNGFGEHNDPLVQHLSEKAVKHSHDIISHEKDHLDKKEIIASGTKRSDGSLILPKLGPRPPGQYEKKKIKLCQFPGCNRYYDGTGFSKYCKELHQLDEKGEDVLNEDGKPIIIWEGHRHRKFRKEIDAKKKKIIKENPNKCYYHNSDKPQDVIFICDLCGSQFEIKVYPQIEIYPRFCESHRSEFRRLYYRLSHHLPSIFTTEQIDPKPEPPEPKIEVETDIEEEIESVREVLEIAGDELTNISEGSDMTFSFEPLDCSLKECLNYLEGDKCDCNLPTSKGKCKPNDKTCVFYSDNMEQDLKDVKAHGGLLEFANKIKTPTPAAPSKGSNTTIPSLTNDDPVKVEITHNGYIIRRLKSHSYRILDSDGNIQNAKPLLIKFLMELDNTLKKEILNKRGTRPLGNTFIRMKGIIL